MDRLIMLAEEHPRLSLVVFIASVVLYQFLADGPMQYVWASAILVFCALLFVYGCLGSDIDDPLLGLLAIVWVATPIGMNLASIAFLSAGWVGLADFLHEWRFWSLFWPVGYVVLMAIASVIMKKTADEYHWFRIRRRRAY